MITQNMFPVYYDLSEAARVEIGQSELHDHAGELIAQGLAPRNAGLGEDQSEVAMNEWQQRCVVDELREGVVGLITDRPIRLARSIIEIARTEPGAAFSPLVIQNVGGRAKNRRCTLRRSLRQMQIDMENYGHVTEAVDIKEGGSSTLVIISGLSAQNLATVMRQYAI